MVWVWVEPHEQDLASTEFLTQVAHADAVALGRVAAVLVFVAFQHQGEIPGGALVDAIGAALAARATVQLPITTRARQPGLVECRKQSSLLDQVLAGHGGWVAALAEPRGVDDAR